MVNRDCKVEFARLVSLFKGKHFLPRCHLIENDWSLVLIIDEWLFVGLVMIEVMVHYLVQYILFLDVLLALLLQSIRHIVLTIFEVFALRLPIIFVLARNIVKLFLEVCLLFFQESLDFILRSDVPIFVPQLL